MMRAFCAVSMVALVAACQPAIPDSGRGVGFDSTAQAQRDAALAGPLVPSATNAPINGAPVQGSAAQTAAQTTAALDATRPASAPVDASPSNPAPVAVNAAGISRENNFDAVSGQRSIESDAARIASNRAQYEIVQPEALPTRRGSGGPNIVAYALQNQHPIGQQVYARGAFSGAARAARNCAAYASADQAQIDFLSRGGPQRDRKGLDPDGDGYACSWDPRPFRKATASVPEPVIPAQEG